MTARLTAVRLPIAWEGLDLPNPLATRSTVLLTGEPGWRWAGATPGLGIAPCDQSPGAAAAGWDLDHVVVLVPDVAAAVTTMADAGVSVRLRVTVGDRPTAFFRVGPLLEVIEAPVRAPSLYGVALMTDEPLEVVTLRWRSMGLDVTDPRPAIQPGRRIITLRGVDAGLAVMSPDGAVAKPHRRAGGAVTAGSVDAGVPDRLEVGDTSVETKGRRRWIGYGSSC